MVLNWALVEAGLYSSVTTAQIFNGNHHLIAWDAHQISLQGLCDLWVEAFFEHSPVLHKPLPVAMHNVREADRNGRDKDQAHVELMKYVRVTTELVFQDIQNGVFAGSTISVPFASIGPD